jgi:MFS family permease
VTRPLALGLRANARQFGLLVGLNAIVGAVVGLERSVLPTLGEDEFGLASKSAVLSFILAFGAAKAFANLAAGSLAGRLGRKRVLVAGWALALPVPVLVAVAPSWGYIVAANLFLGASQGLAWSMTVLMKVDLVGPRRRGFALGLNESAGYVGVALTAAATGLVAASVAPRTLIWAGASVLVVVGLVVAVVFVHETAEHAALEQRDHALAARVRGASVAASQAGFINNLNDAAMWGVVPLYLAAHGASTAEIGAVAGVYPAVWGVGQLAAGALSDIAGRKPLIVLGMFVQAAGLALLVAAHGAFGAAFAAAAILGLGTALVYPTLLAAVSDAAEPRHRARALGAYRFWRDLGLVAGAALAGVVADAVGSGAAIAVVATLTALSGVWVAFARWGQFDGRSKLWPQEVVAWRST